MIRTIISGGQTGADRAALDFALQYGFEIRGFCPKGRRAGDGPLDAKYPLVEMESAAYPPRTEKNVCLAEATVIFNGLTRHSSGTKTAASCARKHGKRYLILKAFPQVDEDAATLGDWLREYRPESLNVAGNGEDKCPGMYGHVLAVLKRTLLEADE